MTPLYYLRHFQNIFSFALRSQVRFKKVPQEADLKKIRIVKLQDELLDFLDLFNWEEIQKREPLILADVGCRDFSFAPVYERKFKDLGFSQMEVHGIEIDAYRRYTNLCSRADYGEAFARKIRNGFYHALDFMKFKKSVDIVFLFHPFVTPEPPLRWDFL